MGWQSCPFFISPKELKTAFEPFKLVINNTCVPIDYTDTPVEEFIKKYSLLYERLLSGEVLEGKDRALLEQIAVTSNLSDVKFGMEHELDGKMVKAVIFDKSISPMPYLSPFTFMTYTENNKTYVSTRASYLAYREFIFGYEINFPKFSQSDADYYGLTSEKEFKTYVDYELFRKNILRITKPLTLNLNGTVRKTAVRISDEAKIHLPNLYCIKSKGIEVV